MLSQGAALPESIPKALWRVLCEIWRIADERHLGLIAAGVAFFAMFAVFPGLAALVSIWSWLSDPNAIGSYLHVISEFMPPEAFALIEGQVRALIATSGGRLGWSTAISLAVALWSTRAGVAAVVQGLNAIHGYRNRGGAKQVLVAMALTLAVLAMAIAGLATVVAVPIALAFVPLGPVQGRVLAGLPWAITFLLLIATLSLVYRYGPNLDRRSRPGWITPGAGLAALLWAAASLAFSIYLSNFGSYNRVYGSLGAGVALLMWFFLSAYAVLLGAALNRALGIGIPFAEREARGHAMTEPAPSAPK